MKNLLDTEIQRRPDASPGQAARPPRPGAEAGARAGNVGGVSGSPVPGEAGRPGGEGAPAPRRPWWWWCPAPPPGAGPLPGSCSARLRGNGNKYNTRLLAVLLQQQQQQTLRLLPARCFPKSPTNFWLVDNGMYNLYSSIIQFSST